MEKVLWDLDAVEVARRHKLPCYDNQTGEEVKDLDFGHMLACDFDGRVYVKVDPDKLEGGVHGVIGQDAVNGTALAEELMNKGIDLSMFQHEQFCQGECVHCQCSHPRSTCKCDILPHEYDPEPDEHGCCNVTQHGDFLIGGWKLTDTGYEPDTDAEYSAIVQDKHGRMITVCHSKHKAFGVRFNSWTGEKASLARQGTILCYTLPPKFFAESVKFTEA